MAARNPLSRERIVDASFGLLESEGWEALSMRRLAQELDVWPMAVYRYFRDKDELVEALVEHAALAIELPDDRGDWRERLRGILAAVRLTLDRLPPELRGRLGALLVDPDGVAATGTEVLESAGLDPEAARLAWSALAAYTIGVVEIGPGDDGFEYGLERLLDGLDQPQPLSA
jgi:TetR/AcrR family transcriptional regulator, tetracycline repressor protein